MNYRNWGINNIMIMKQRYRRMNGSYNKIQRNLDKFYKYNEMYIIDEWEG